MYYTFVEATKFTQRVTKLKLENNLRKLQEDLLENPEKGDTDPTSSSSTPRTSRTS